MQFCLLLLHLYNMKKNEIHIHNFCLLTLCVINMVKVPECYFKYFTCLPLCVCPSLICNNPIWNAFWAHIMWKSQSLIIIVAEVKAKFWTMCVYFFFVFCSFIHWKCEPKFGQLVGFIRFQNSFKISLCAFFSLYFPSRLIATDNNMTFFTFLIATARDRFFIRYLKNLIISSNSIEHYD